MRPADPAPPAPDAALVRALAATAAEHGIGPTGICDASVLVTARAELHRRRDAGLHDGMHFTYKNPDRSTDPSQAVAGAQSVFVGALPYFVDSPPRPDGPTGAIARYAWNDFYQPLRTGLWAVAHQLRALGWKAVVFADDNSIVDRAVAHRAGIGWFGKSSNVLVPGAGSWFVLGCVITDAPLPPSDGPVDDGCGACRRCIDACPTGAIVADGVIDAARCLAWVLQKPGIIPVHLRAALGDRLYGCDDCQTACPPTIRFGPTRSSAGHVDAPKAWVPLLDVLNAADDGVMDVWGRWYLADRDPRWVRRNALVALGNVADGSDRDVLATVARYLADPDPMLRAHAVWAARQLGADHMLPAADLDPDVHAELVAAR